mmetsp:Transcript_53708/g.123074  ORF Transcript_53708/g.123074 Transcript_53708/m.123074 type:complete len:235 (+) Transcript_53708:2490-3194(+)
MRGAGRQRCVRAQPVLSPGRSDSHRGHPRRLATHHQALGRAGSPVQHVLVHRRLVRGARHPHHPADLPSVYVSVGERQPASQVGWNGSVNNRHTNTVAHLPVAVHAVDHKPAGIGWPGGASGNPVGDESSSLVNSSQRRPHPLALSRLPVDGVPRHRPLVLRGRDAHSAPKLQRPRVRVHKGNPRRWERGHAAVHEANGAGAPRFTVAVGGECQHVGGVGRHDCVGPEAEHEGL